MSSLANKVDVLVVGAGPTGLMSALALVRAGVEVEIIDRAWRSTSQSYACGLHGASLDLLASFGLADKAKEAGLAVDVLGVYEGTRRQAELRFDTPGGRAGLMVLPQDRLEEMLEEELRRYHVRVRWGHRLDAFTQDDQAVTATVERLGLTSVGYPYARSEEMVESETEVRARFIVGADGSSSHVRQILGLPVQTVGKPLAFDVYEFEPVKDAGREVRVSVGEKTADVFWPQPDWTCRWSLEIADLNDLPAKQGERFLLRDDGATEAERREAEERIRSHAPWYDAGVKAIDWTTVVGFEPQLASSFGTGRSWLVGDAAHQTSPIGMQSMNVGLREATDLASRIVQRLKESAPESILEQYNAERLAEWRFLLGLESGLKPAGKTTPAWIASRCSRLLPYLPGSGEALLQLAGQLGLVKA